MNALFIAYHFPPIGGAGTQRSLKFTKYLPANAVDPIVITGPGPSSSRWEPEDFTLVGEIPPSTPVFRATAQNPEGGSFGAWWGSQIDELGVRAANNHELSVILVTLTPYEGLLPALALGVKLGLPVVADLRDPWALDEVKSYRTRIHRQRDLRDMVAALRECSRVVMNTEEAAVAVLEAFGELDPRRVAVIPNGFDAADFSYQVPPRNDDRFRIVHTGYLHAELARANRRLSGLKRALGGSMWQIDLETRSHVYLLRAVEELTNVDPGLAERIEIVLAGVLSETDRQIIRDSAVGDRVLQLGYVNHGEAVNLMRSADALFLPLHDVPTGRRSRIVPGKAYEYLASGTPIVAAVPAGDTRDLMRRSGAGITTSPTDVVGIARAVRDISECPDRFRVDATFLRAYERQNQARELAGVLHQAASEGLVHPGNSGDLWPWKRG